MISTVIYVPIVIHTETEVLGAFSTEDAAISRLAKSVAAANRDVFTLKIEKYLLDGRYLGCTYPFKEETMDDFD